MFQNVATGIGTQDFVTIFLFSGATLLCVNWPP